MDMRRTVAFGLADLDTGNSFTLDVAHSTMLQALAGNVDDALSQSGFLLLTVSHRSLMGGAARLMNQGDRQLAPSAPSLEQPSADFTFEEQAAEADVRTPSAVDSPPRRENTWTRPPGGEE